MRMRAALIIGFFLCVVPRLHASRFVTGNDLLKECQAVINREDGQTLSRDAQDDSLLCLAYIEGTLDTQSATLDLHPDMKTFRYCAPEDVPLVQIVRVVVKFLKAHPERLNMHASVLVLVSLVDAFPCH